MALHSPSDPIPFQPGYSHSFGYIPLIVTYNYNRNFYLAPIQGKTSELLTMLQVSQKNFRVKWERRGMRICPWIGCDLWSITSTTWLKNPQGQNYSQIMDEKRQGILIRVIGKHRHPENKIFCHCTRPTTPKDGQVRQPMDKGKWE